MLVIAQIGIGYWGPNLLRNFATNPHCKVKTVVDTAKSRRDFVRTQYPQITTTADTKTVFTDPEIDAIVIATPVATHFDLTMEALRMGKHVLVENPLARTPKEIEEIQELSVKKQLVAMVGHTFIYNPAVRYIKNLIKTNLVLWKHYQFKVIRMKKRNLKLSSERDMIVN